MLTERGTSTGVITVADLLSRCAPEPVIDPEPATTPVTVGSLLRREGREPHAGDRPVQARSARQPDAYEDDAGTPARRGPALRRSAIAAGILLAAGSVFGAITVMSTSSSSPTADAPRPTGGYPGQGLLDPRQQVPDGAIPTVVDNTTQSESLDPGTGAPTSWMSIAVPGGDGGGSDDAPSGPTGSAVPPTGGTEAPQGNAAPLGATDTEDDAPSGDRGGFPQDNGSDRPDQGGGNNQGGGPDQGGGNNQGGGPDRGDPDGEQGGSEQPQEDSGGDGVIGGAVEDLGSALPDPLGDPVQSLGRAVSGLL
jgi:hypothetical protein